MKIFSAQICLASIAALTLAACTSTDGRYPSLAMRDAERATGEFTPAPSAQPLAEPIVSPQDVADLLSTAYGAQRRFEELRPDAQRLVRQAQGAGDESDRRSQALIAVAELTSLRGQTAQVLARLDALEAEARTTFAPSDTIESGQAHTAGLLRKQDEVLDSLSEMLAR